MLAICETDPIGGEIPWRAAITPAMKVDATAPMPGVRTPSLPAAGAMSRAVMRPTIKQWLMRMSYREARLN
jgi:hypothetical protein